MWSINTIIFFSSSQSHHSFPNANVSDVWPSSVPSPNSSSCLGIASVGISTYQCPLDLNVPTNKRGRDLPQHQITLDASYAPRLKEEAQIVECHFFYQCNLVFHIALCLEHHKFYNSLVQLPHRSYWTLLIFRSMGDVPICVGSFMQEYKLCI